MHGQETNTALDTSAGKGAMLHELVYFSRAADGWVHAAALDELLVVSRDKNKRLDITGLLLYERGEFVQLLEGPAEAVRTLYYGTIARDARHRRPLVCWEHAKPARSFATWQMGFARGGAPAGAAAMPEGFITPGLSTLDLTGPRSTGRDMLLAVYGDMGAK